MTTGSLRPTKLEQLAVYMLQIGCSRNNLLLLQYPDTERLATRAGLTYDEFNDCRSYLVKHSLGDYDRTGNLRDALDELAGA
jgi:hypothetical protein